MLTRRVAASQRSAGVRGHGARRRSPAPPHRGGVEAGVRGNACAGGGVVWAVLGVETLAVPVVSVVMWAERGRGGALGKRSGKTGVSGPENNMSIPSPYGGRRDASSGRTWARRLNGNPSLIRHGGA